MKRCFLDNVTNYLWLRRTLFVHWSISWWRELGFHKLSFYILLLYIILNNTVLYTLKCLTTNGWDIEERYRIIINVLPGFEGYGRSLGSTIRHFLFVYFLPEHLQAYQCSVLEQYTLLASFCMTQESIGRGFSAIKIKTKVRKTHWWYFKYLGDFIWQLHFSMSNFAPYFSTLRWKFCGCRRTTCFFYMCSILL